MQMHSEGIFLRRITSDDLRAMFECRNNPQIRVWTRQNTLLHWDNHESWFNAQSKDPTISMYTIRTEDNFFAGVAGLTSIDLVNRRAEFSCYVAPNLQGNGIGRKALVILFKHGFYELGLNRIWGETYEDNPAIDLFYKLGMEKEGTRNEFYFRNGRFIDCHIISISRAMFDSLHSVNEKTPPPRNPPTASAAP